MQEQAPSVIELERDVDQGADAADVAEAQPAQIEVRVLGVEKRETKRLADRVRVCDVDLAGEAQPCRFGGAGDHKVLVRVNRTVAQNDGESVLDEIPLPSPGKTYVLSRGR